MRNSFTIKDNIVEIMLPYFNKNKKPLIAIIDLEKLHIVNKYQGFWRPFLSRNTYYAVIRHRISGAPIAYMHHVILGTTIQDDIMPAHKNRNGLDNRKENLHVVSRSKNRINSFIGSNNTSGIVGVFWHKLKKKRNATIIRNGNRMNLGDYKTKIEAREVRFIAEQILD